MNRLLHLLLFSRSLYPTWGSKVSLPLEIRRVGEDRLGWLGWVLGDVAGGDTS